MMRTYIWVLAFATIALLCHETLSLDTDQYERPDPGKTNGVFYQICLDHPFNSPVSAPAEILLASDSDLGCCVLKTSGTRCVYTNRAYCKRKAEQAGVRFEFYVGTGCKSLVACK